MSHQPVLTGLCFTALGTKTPMNIAQPKIAKFLDNFRSTDCKVDKPTPPTIEHETTKMAPTNGSGIVAKTAPNFVNMPKITKNTAAICIGRRLAI